MWIPWTIVAVIIIVMANWTRKQWPRDIFDIVIYISCITIALDYYV